MSSRVAQSFASQKLCGRSGPSIPLLSSQDLQTLRDVSGRMRFDVVFGPRIRCDPALSSLFEGSDTLMVSLGIDVSPPSDDRPFFFNAVRLRDVFRAGLPKGSALGFNVEALSLLVGLLVVVFVLSGFCIVVALALETKGGPLEGSLSHFIFFSAIGLGFMLVEVSQMERLVVFLGHPTYGLSVVLFALLLSSGLGSYSTQGVESDRAAPRLLILIAVLLVFAMLTPLVISRFQPATTTVRILVAIVTLFPAGVAMGMAFPLGLRLALSRSESLGGPGCGASMAPHLSVARCSR